MRPYATRQNQKSTTMPKSILNGWWRATAGREGARRKYTTFPNTMATSVWRKLTSTGDLDTAGILLVADRFGDE
jgi:hypothetical protein